MIPVLVALSDRRQRIRDYGKHATGTPARHILDSWTVDARTPVPGTHTSTRANDRGTGSGSPTVPALVDPPRPAEAYCPDCVEGSGIRTDGTDCVTCGGIGVRKPIGFRAVVLRVLPHADAPTVLDLPGRRSAHQNGVS